MLKNGFSYLKKTSKNYFLKSALLNFKFIHVTCNNLLKDNNNKIWQNSTVIRNQRQQVLYFLIDFYFLNFLYS